MAASRAALHRLSRLPLFVSCFYLSLIPVQCIQLQEDKCCTIISPSRNISYAEGIREVTGYLQDEMSITLNHDIAETLEVNFKEMICRVEQINAIFTERNVTIQIV